MADITTIAPQSDEISWTQILKIIEEITRRGVLIEGEHAAAGAKEIANKQKEFHQALIVYVSDWCTRTDNQGELGNALAQFRQNYIDRIMVENSVSVVQDGAGYIVTAYGRLPILMPSSIDIIKSILPTNAGAPFASSVVGSMMAIYIHATRNAVGRSSASINGAFDRLLSFYSPKVVFVDMLLRERPAEMIEAIGRSDAKLAETSVAADELRSLIEQSAQKIAELQIRNESNTKYGDSFLEQLKGIQNDVSGWKRAIDEQIKLDSARTLWGTRARNDAWAFYLSGIVLALILIGIPVAAFWHRNEILAFLLTVEGALKQGSSGDDVVANTITAVGRLALISAPLAFVVWMVRLIVRYNMRSMLLMDDAQQRVTMLNTYLYLIERDGASKADRGAILEALFRRAPGHGPDTVEPPHFTDLLKYGQDSGPNKPG